MLFLNVVLKAIETLSMKTNYIKKLLLYATIHLKFIYLGIFI